MRCIGIDIGGANTKLADLTMDSVGRINAKVTSNYFPFWKKSMDQFIQALGKWIGNPASIDRIALCITAELSDGFRTKAEGVSKILKSFNSRFVSSCTQVLGTDGVFHSIRESIENPQVVAAANWPATGWLVAQKIPDGIIVDTGSTTTSIIPIRNGPVVAEGKTDLEKLQNGELVYTGALRTTIPAIVSNLGVKGIVTLVSSEWFAQTGDVYLVLGHLSSQDYNVDTPDGRGVDKSSALGRLAKVVCADTDMLTELEILDMAQQIYETQVNQIQTGLIKVLERYRRRFPEFGSSSNIPIITAGIGGPFLGKRAVERIQYVTEINLKSLYQNSIAKCAPAYGVGLMGMENALWRI